MKILEWLGWNYEASPYLLRRGELRSLVNLQASRRGMLLTRAGMLKFFGESAGEAIMGMYRKITPFGVSNILIIFQKAVRPSQDLATDGTPIWRVSRLTGSPYQSQVIDEQVLSPNGLTTITNMSVSEDRHGRLFIFYGHGAKPVMYRPDLAGSLGVEMGMPAPTVQPVITPTGEGYFIERVDVTSGGGSYWDAPPITVEGGDPDRPAILKGVVQKGNLVAVDVIDGGSNYKTFPGVTVGTDKIGKGLRAIGLRENDPGIAGFFDTSPGVVNPAHAPADGETFGLTNELDNNSILYLSSPVVLNTTTLYPSGQTNTSTTNQVQVASVAGVKIGDIVTMRGAGHPAPFNLSTSVVRVIGISSANATGLANTPTVGQLTTTHTVTLSKTWTRDATRTYSVQFRRDWSIGTAPATYDATTKRFSASFPLMNRRGTGQGAEATATFTPAGDGYALGPTTVQNFTVPAVYGGGSGTPIFGYRMQSWDNYQAWTNQYWQGTASGAGETPKDKQLREYTGLQASGKQFVYGYSGPVDKAGGKNGDIYWPDYSEISVWICVGRLGDGLNRWKRVDAKVYDHDTDPYAIVTLEPTVKGVSEPQKKGKQRDVPWKRTSSVRPPQIRINLKKCPDSWVSNFATGAFYNYNLPNWRKNTLNPKSQWWHQSGLTKRPVVDFRSQTGAQIDSSTIEIVDGGAGWEKNTLFAIRIYQANPYDQIIDTNAKTSPIAIPTTGSRANRNRVHQAFSTTTRFAEFVLRATTPDDQQLPGPPAILESTPVVDVGGTNYRANDVSHLVLLKRNTDGGTERLYRSFTGYFSARGDSTEFTTAAGTQSGTYMRTAGSNILTVTTPTSHGLTPGDRVILDFTTGTAQDGNYNILTTPTATTFTVEHEFSGSVNGNVTITGGSFWPRQIAGARIVRTAGQDITPNALPRSIVKCEQPNVLFDFTQVLDSVVVNGFQTIGLDKMAYPITRLASSIRCGYDSTSNTTVAGVQRTKLTGVPLTISGESVAESLVVGQKIYFAGNNSLSPRTTTILEVVRTEGNTTTVDLWVQGQVNGSGLVNFFLAYDFNVYTGVTQSQTVEFTAVSLNGTGDGSQKIIAIRILSAGKNYFAPPVIEFRGGGGGYGLDVEAKVSGGKVTELRVIDPGTGWTSDPELYTSSTAATVVPVMRPALRGKYQCAYRFVDRSETVVKTVTITGVEGDDAAKVTVSDAAGIKPGMVVESQRSNMGAKVVSVSGNVLTLSSKAIGVGPISTVVVETPGFGYAENETVTVTIPSAKPSGWEGDWPTPTATFTAVLQVRQPAPGESAAVVRYEVRNVNVTSAGNAKYPAGRVPLIFSPPAASGGAAATGYAHITAFDSALSNSAIIRDMTKPVTYSDFSPIVEVDAGPNEEREHANKLTWQLPGVIPPERADLVEFYRTSSDQALVFYRLDMYGVPTDKGVTIVGEDTLTDEELFDPDRDHYAALPVVLPNGALNAYRFGQPRTDMSACVAFQDRLWYGVSTSGKDANTIYYSEYDEFESCPEANELPIQNNYRSTDSVTALAPFGSILLVMQTSHTYAVSYNSDPSTDATIQMISHRGCLNQRCWDVFDNVLYAADESGIYSMTRAGEVENLSLPLRDFFSRELIDFSKRETFHLKVCERTSVLRFFCTLADAPTETPSHVFCYHLSQKTWWLEQYPNSLCSAVSARPSLLRVSSTVYGAVDGNIYELDGDADHANGSIVSVQITDSGSGYRDAPKVYARNGQGAEFQAVVSEGRLTDIIVLAGGWGYFQSPSMLAENGDYITTEGAVANSNNFRGQRITYGGDVPLELEIDPPPFIGPSLLTEAGSPIVLEQGGRLRQGDDSPSSAIAIVAKATECFATAAFSANSNTITLAQANELIVPGMEAISAHIPQGCFVRSINGTTAVLEFADGTDAKAIQTSDAGRIRFYKHFRTNVPFLFRTGHMEVINESNTQRGGGALMDRSITLLYTPTQSDKSLELLEYYNGSETPRSNIARNARGGTGGFQHRQSGASTVLNTSKTASHLANATGIAKATFAGRSNEDSTGTDRHIQVVMLGRPSPANGNTGDTEPQRLTLHSVLVQGVVEYGE